MNYWINDPWPHTNPYPSNPRPWTPKPWVAPIPLTPSFPQIKQDLAASFKPVKAGKSGAHVVVVLDDSFSMNGVRVQTVSGLNEFKNGQAADARETGVTTWFTLYKFDGHNIWRVIDRADVTELRDFTLEDYDPRGGTNLNDAVGGVLIELNNGLKAVKREQRPAVVVAFFTDGEENSSKTFSNADVKRMIGKLEEANWGTMFFGANIDAFHAGAVYGFNPLTTMQYNTVASEGSFRSASAAANRAKAAYLSGDSGAAAYAAMSFNASEREDSILGGAPSGKL